jgi:hypothetical protein
MSPHDPRWPSPTPFTPRFRPPPGYQPAAQLPATVGAASPHLHGHQQHAAYASSPYASSPYAQASHPAPTPQPHAHHTPAPQYQPQYTPSPYAHGAPQLEPPRKKGLGVGAIVAILAVVFVVLGGGLGVGAFLLYGPTAGLSDDVDQSAALRDKVQALATAVRSGDAKKVEDPLLALAILPDRAGLWFKDTFGPELGQRLQEEWERDVFRQLPSLITPFKDANKNGQTEIKIRRITSIQPGTDKFEQNLLRARKQRRALYVVTMAHPGQQYGENVYYFAIVDGRFGYVGHMVSAW